MADNENHPPEQKKPERKLQLDLSEAMPHGFDEDDDEIIELKDEVEIEPKKTETEIEPFENTDGPDPAPELPAVEKIIDLDALEDDDSDAENVIRLSEDLTFDEEDEDGIDILPIEKEPVLKADDHDDVTEITEFDDILSEDKNEMVTLSELSETIDIEDDDEFLELIDVEEDEEAELEEIEEELIQFNESDSDTEDAELKDFINDSLDEEIQINDDLEDDLTGTPGLDAGQELNMTAPESMEEDFDFSLDSDEISKKIDQLDTIFFNDIEAEAEFEEDVEIEEDAEIQEQTAGFDEKTVGIPDTVFEDIEDEIETEDTGTSGGEPADVPLAASGIAALNAGQGRLDETLEQIIERKFSGKIETLVTEIIEKAVSKEIQRLKKILLEDEGDEAL